jgi:hypothetical protein
VEEIAVHSGTTLAASMAVYMYLVDLQRANYVQLRLQLFFGLWLGSSMCLGRVIPVILSTSAVRYAVD